jgi:hypothetical protein
MLWKKALIMPTYGIFQIESMLWKKALIMPTYDISTYRATHVNVTKTRPQLNFERKILKLFLYLVIFSNTNLNDKNFTKRRHIRLTIL